MPTTCTAHGCENRYGQEGLCWKKIPRDKKLRKTWIDKINRKKLPNDIYLCSDHFTADCFERDFKAEFESGSPTPIYKIKDGSIPTKFSYSSCTLVREASVRREEKLRRKELVYEAIQDTPSSSRHNIIDSFPSYAHDHIDVVVDNSIYASPDEKTQFVSCATNTDLSFNPFDDISFSCSSSSHNTLYIEELDDSYEAHTDEVLDHDSHDDDYNDEGFLVDDALSDDIESSCDEENSEAIDDVNENDLSCDADMKFIVFFSSLLPLLKFCLDCRAPALIESISNRGTAISVTLLCEKGHSSNWKSQPIFHGMYAGNLLVAAATLFSGSTYTHIREISNILKLQLFSEPTFLRIQRKYLFPAISFVYEKYQKKAIEECIATGNVLLAGDGRCDSPGFSAKYCTYSLMNSENNQVIDFEVINVAETGSSSTMEKEGLIRVLRRIQGHKFTIQSLTTDRHVQIVKHMREQTNIKHQFDVWHTSKSVKKKLTADSKKKD